MPPHCQLVIGPAGVGKSTYCQAMQEHGAASRNKVHVANLDPAAESFGYAVAFDIRDLISLEDVMEETHGGLNAPTGRGGLEAVDNDLPQGANLLVRQKLAHVGALIAAELDDILAFRVLVQGSVAREVLLEGLRLAGGGARRERKGRRKINA